MRFKDIIGQEQVKQQLRLSAIENRVPHAQLFYGPKGVGKLQLAIAYAQYLACGNRTQDDSCGKCPTCLQYSKLQHPDLHFVFPIYKEKSDRQSVCDDFIERFRNIILQKGYFSFDEWFDAAGAENKQGMIYEAESGEILRKLSLKSFGNGYKTMIIWQPEKMHEACANKLLKIIEEPPEKTLFLLVSDEPERLLPTILSRTQQIKIPLLEEDTIAHALREKYEDISIEDAIDYAHIANGSWHRALSIVQASSTNQQNLEQFKQLMRAAWRVGVRREYDALIELRTWSQKIATLGREQQKNFLQYSQNQIRENYIRNLREPELNYQTRDETDFSKNFARFINERNVEDIMQQLDLAERQIAQNANSKIVWFDLCLQLIVLIKK